MLPALAVVLTLASPPAAPAPDETTPNGRVVGTPPVVSELHASADGLLLAGSAALAADAYREVLEDEPRNGRAWYRLGICLLDVGPFADAAEAFARAGELGWRTSDAHYNSACAHALDGDVDAGYALLDRAVATGFTDMDHMAVDPDLTALRDDPRWDEVCVQETRTAPEGARPVTLEATDGATVHAEWTPVLGADGEEDLAAPVVMLLHQAGSNLAEYDSVVPRLNALGWACLATDARGGGRAWGRGNLTVDAAGARGGGEEASRDFAGAVRWLRDRGCTGPLAAIGSSYSAGRVYLLLADHPDEFACGVAYSGGRRFAQPGPDGEPSWASRVAAPVMYSVPVFEYEADSPERFAAIAGTDNLFRIQARGVHGASTLDPRRNPAGWEEEWAALRDWLAAHLREG